MPFDLDWCFRPPEVGRTESRSDPVFSGNLSGPDYGVQGIFGICRTDWVRLVVSNKVSTDIIVVSKTLKRLGWTWSRRFLGPPSPKTLKTHRVFSIN